MQLGEEALRAAVKDMGGDARGNIDRASVQVRLAVARLGRTRAAFRL
eukprot:SAG11_NODE_5023_length_1688_cov_1.684707_2_plen_47_part_00